jgi:uncharacterized protein YdcH (DUF465 family)
MGKPDHLAIQHRLLDQQIDDLERKHLMPDTDEEKMIADLKKERLNIKDQIVLAKLEDINAQSRT